MVLAFRRPSRLHLAIVGLLGLAACTDWTARGGTPDVVAQLSAGNLMMLDAGADTQAGLSWWETWTPPSGNVADGGGSPGEDAADAAAQDLGETPTDVAGADAAGDAVADVAPIDAAPLVDASALDTAIDADPACSGANKAFGCPCASSAQCVTGLCTLGPAGPVCSQPCAKTGCPSGWSCAPPALVCKPIAPPDAGTPDAGPTDVADVDATSGVDTAIAFDTASPETMGDVSEVDTLVSDVAVPDAIGPDVATLDSGIIDAGGPDGFVYDSGWIPDGIITVDAQPADIQNPDSAYQDAGYSGTDWQGYPDASWPEDADIYGGAINSCLAVYLFQQESCGKNAPSAACIDDAAKVGSLYANFLFEPLAVCQQAVCVPQCAGATDGLCMEQCVGKHCTGQFLACVANNTSGGADCATTFTCADKYPDKLLSIASACYANASPAAQKQMAGLIGCVSKPQTQSCLDQIATCYAVPNANSNCGATVNCMQGCSGSNPCTWQCLGKSSVASIQLLQAFWDCSLQQCGYCGEDQACKDACNGQQCGMQLKECLAN